MARFKDERAPNKRGGPAVNYLISLVLVVVSAVLLLVGASTGAIALYVLAAVGSAVAIALLVVRARAKRERTYVTDAPVARAPEWDRPIRRAGSMLPPEGIEIPPVSIDRYDDLVAAEVLPNLEVLSVDELRDVILRERYGMGRLAIIRRAETLIDNALGNGSAQRMVKTRSVIDDQILVIDGPEHKRSGPNLSL